MKAWKTFYLVHFVAVYWGLVILFSFTLSAEGILRLIWLLFFLVWGLPIAETLTETVLFVLARRNFVPPRLAQLNTQPKVALLYCTCKDAVEDCVRKLAGQTYENVTAYILDDSPPGFEQEVDLSAYRVIRRHLSQDRAESGYKAGNINHWLRTYGGDFDYCVVLDADSLLPVDFVEKMLLYAEHPANARGVFFESCIRLWSPVNFLQRAQTMQLEMLAAANLRLSNRLGIMLSNGHNNLCRIRALQEVNGFDEKYISEDHATTLNLLARGWECLLVDIGSYEIGPLNLSGHKRRRYRWTRNDLQLLIHSWEKTSLLLQLKLVIRVVRIFLSVAVIPLMVLVLWANHSAWSDIPLVYRYLRENFGSYSFQLMTFLIVWAIYIFNLFITPLPAARITRQPLKQFLLSFITNLSLNLGVTFTVAKAIGDSSRRKVFGFDVTPKTQTISDFANFFAQHWLLFVLAGIILAGCFNNPAALIFHWVWILPVVFCPFWLYFSEKPVRSRIS